MKRNPMWVVGVALAVALAGCGDAVDGGAGSATGPAPTTTTQREVVASTESVATAERPVAASIESTSTTLSAGERTATTITSDESSTEATVTAHEVSADASDGPLDESTVEGLLWMREEEKLARDVYLTLSERWDLPIFANIAGSEQTHTDAVGDLLELYGIPDPMAVDLAGVFVDPAIQALYDRLVVQGSRSLTDALIVGAAIEDMDIVDLRLRETGIPAIDAVYANLQKGSRNHLRAFVRTLESRGGEYSPAYLTTADYVAIIDAPTERGRTGG